METAKGAKVLVVEDDQLLCDNIALILRMEGYHVTVAENGREGLAAIAAMTPDLVLCDILMPDIDGFELHRQVKEILAMSSVPFIFISALNEHHHQRRGMEAGADDYLCKPFTTEELIASVRSRLRRFAALAAAKEAEALGEAELKALRLVSQRELEILLLVASGITSREIAERLFISPKTVEVHRSRLMRKLGASNAATLSRWAELAELASRQGLLGKPKGSAAALNKQGLGHGINCAGH